MRFLALAIVMLAFAGVVSAQDFVKPVGDIQVSKIVFPDEAKLGASDIGLSLLDNSRDGAIIQLSGTDASVFDAGFFSLVDEWVFDISNTYTPSQRAFMADDASEGRGLGNVSSNAAFVGTKVLDADPRDV